MAYLSASTRRSLCASNLSVNFGGVRAVNNLCFDARPGDITSIIGPNGAGKSTVLNLVCGFYRPDSGVVRLGETDVTRIATHSIAQQGIARTYQTTQLFTHMTVLDNVLIALRRGHLEARTIFSWGLDLDHQELAQILLAFVGYRAPLDQLAGALPHADNRLVEIWPAQVLQPSVLAQHGPAARLHSSDATPLADLHPTGARNYL